LIEVHPAPVEHYGWIAQRANLTISKGFMAIGAYAADGRILGMVGYDGWTPNSCCMHVAIDSPIAIRRLRRPAFGIPFLELKKGLVLASVLSTNKNSLRFVAGPRGLGFTQIAGIRDGYEPGVHVMLFEMRRENWDGR